uniref:Ribosome-binding factor A n=1 Tax=Chrysotila carterae TaxID=13221 RepID=A0A7S4AYU9_CHRCT|mmetsp:Transcript_2513/g.5161  ORF Transcript_2513/g.5161 Transcript_2513/m.5161 type:complete len:241 (-) Transcript_2513:564-1286(-)
MLPRLLQGARCCVGFSLFVCLLAQKSLQVEAFTHGAANRIGAVSVARSAQPVCKVLTRGRRPNRVAQVLQEELSMVLRVGNVRGQKPISDNLMCMIQIINVDVSPDLGQARVKVSVIGDRKDKITAIRWLQRNTGSIRYALAQRVRQMKRVPRLSFLHVDVGKAVDVMITIDQLNKKESNGSYGGLDFDEDEDAFGDIEQALAEEYAVDADFDDDDDDDILLDFDEADDQEDGPFVTRRP